MSRCFPFPPPGYSGKCSSNEALILSIKPQQEKEKSKPDREKEKAKSSERKKDRKKEKKEKEKKREERKASAGVNDEKQKLIEKLYQGGKCQVQPNGKSTLQDVSGHLEKSSVTEEHGRPYLQNVTSSTDSTGNSCKRKRPSTPPNGIQSNGNVLRIRLSSSHKRDEPSTSGSKEQEISVQLHRRAAHGPSFSKVQPCSNIIKTDFSTRQRDLTVKPPQDFSHFASTSKPAIQSASKQQDEAVPSLPHVKTESVVPKEKLSSHEKKLRKKESKYNKLFESWAPLPLESGLVIDDGDDADDWLFGKKGEERAAKRMKSSDVESSGDNLLSCASFALQPRSIFLPEADIYALPFTVPF